MTPILGRIAAIAAGLVIAVLLVEGTIRLLDLDEPQIQLAIVGSQTPTSAYDPLLGWKNLPDSAGWLQWPETDRRFHLSTNRQGFRFPRDYTIRKNRPYRLALVGDSQVFGFIVDDDQHLGALLDSSMPQIETYSFGVPGYGPTQESLLLEHTVVPYAPDVVVAVLFLHNDLNDETEDIAYGFLSKPYLHRVDRLWKVGNLPVPIPVIPPPTGARRYLHADATWFERSALYRFLSFRGATTPALGQALADSGWVSLEDVALRPERSGAPDAGFRRIDGTEPACNVASQCPLARWLDGLPAAIAAYTRMAETCRLNGMRFVALVAPAPTELVWRKLGMTQAVVKALRTEGIDTISLEDTFMRFLDPMDLIARDLHWNADGTRVVAAVVQERVEQLLGTASGRGALTTSQASIY